MRKSSRFVRDVKKKKLAQEIASAFCHCPFHDISWHTVEVAFHSL